MPVMGLDGRTYLNTGTFGVPVWAHVDRIEDLNLGITGEMAEVPSRAALAWAWKLPGIRDFAPEFNLIYERTNAIQTLIQAAFFTRLTLDFIFLDGPVESNSPGYRGQFYVAEFSKGEPLREGMKIPVKLALAAGTFPTTFN